MLSALFLPIIIIVLFLLRQNLIVILGIATAYAYWAFGDGVISNIVVDAWDAANKRHIALHTIIHTCWKYYVERRDGITTH